MSMQIVEKSGDGLSRVFGVTVPMAELNAALDARIAEVVDEVYALFLDLDADEKQIEFPIVYSNARAGQATLDPEHPGEDLTARLAKAVAGHAVEAAGQAVETVKEGASLEEQFLEATGAASEKLATN